MTVISERLTKHAMIKEILQTEEILELQKLAVTTGYDYPMVRSALVKMTKDRLAAQGWVIAETDTVVGLINSLVLHPLRIVDPAADWKRDDRHKDLVILDALRMIQGVEDVL